MLAYALGQATQSALAVIIAEVPGGPHFAKIYTAAASLVDSRLRDRGALHDDRPSRGVAFRELAGIYELAAFDAVRRVDLHEWCVFEPHACQNNACVYCDYAIVLCLEAGPGSTAYGRGERMPKRAATPDDFYSIRTVFDPRVSPDGRRVAYGVSWA